MIKPMKKIEVLVRAIIQQKGKILVCKKIGKKYYFFPGGHVEFGENAKRALFRELKEELGIVPVESVLIGGSEHIFSEEGKKHHEINLVFWVSVKKIKAESKEDHLRFFFFDRKQLAKENILPKALKNALLKWLGDPTGKSSTSYGASKKFFWESGI